MQICCGDIDDIGIVGKFAVDIPHQFMGAMAGPVEDHCLVNDRYSFELVIGDKGPFRKVFPELLRHILMATQEQNAFLREGSLVFTHPAGPPPEPNGDLLSRPQ